MTESNALIAALSQAQSRLEDAMSQIEDLEYKIAELRGVAREARNEETVLMGILERQGMGSEALATQAGRGTSSGSALLDWSNKPRVDAVYDAVVELTRADGFATPGSIRGYLLERNRDESRDVIGAALSYLRKTARKIESHKRAEWVPVEASAPGKAQTRSEEG